MLKLEMPISINDLLINEHNLMITNLQPIQSNSLKYPQNWNPKAKKSKFYTDVICNMEMVV